MHCFTELGIMLVLIFWKQFILKSLIHIEVTQILYGGKTLIPCLELLFSREKLWELQIIKKE